MWNNSGLHVLSLVNLEVRVDVQATTELRRRPRKRGKATISHDSLERNAGRRGTEKDGLAHFGAEQRGDGEEDGQRTVQIPDVGGSHAGLSWTWLKRCSKLD